MPGLIFFLNRFHMTDVALYEPLLESPARPSAWLRHAPLLAALLGATVYVVTLWGDFVYDDWGAILLNNAVQQPDQWWRLWMKGYWELSPDRLYRPLILQSFAVQWWMHGKHAWPFHAVNIALHAIVSAQVVGVGRRISTPLIGLLAGLLFAVHPVHVEAAANIVGRAELLCTAAMLAGILLVLNRPLTIGKGIAISACMIIALLSKEHGLLTPFLLALAWYLQPKPKVLDAREKQALKMTFIFVTYLFCAYVFFREIFLNLKMTFDPQQLVWQQNPLAFAKGLDRLLLPLTVFGHYVMLLVCPFKMSIDYGGGVVGDQVSFADPYFWIGAVSTIAGIVSIVLAFMKRMRPLLLCLLAFCVCYGLISNSVMLIGTVVAERIAYLPSVFVCLILAILLAAIPRKPRVAIVTLLLVLGTLRTVTYAWQWNNQERVMEYTLWSQPRATHIRVFVIQDCIKRGDLERAERLAAEGRRLVPKDVEIWLTSAAVAIAQQRPDEAQAYLDTAQKIDLVPMIADLRNQIDDQRKAMNADENLHRN